MEESNQVSVKNEPICYNQANKRSNLEKSIKLERHSKPMKPIGDSKRSREDISSDSIPNKRKRQSIFVKEEPKDNKMQTTKSQIEVEVKAEEKYEEFSDKISIAFLNEETAIEINEPNKPNSNVSMDKQRYKCDFCEKRFNYSSSFVVHQRTHTGEKPYECDFCQKRFIQLNNLLNHRRIHTGERPFECNFCQKRFNTSSHLNIHRRVHTGEKPYECGICQKRFYTSTALRYHRKTHTGDKPYECEVCKKSFIQPNNLAVHRRTHSKQKN